MIKDDEIEICPSCAVKSEDYCDDPKCPGNINRRKLELYEKIIEHFKYKRLGGAIRAGDLRFLDKAERIEEGGSIRPRELRRGDDVD